jgi:hypothetical protein
MDRVIALSVLFSFQDLVAEATQKVPLWRAAWGWLGAGAWH